MNREIKFRGWNVEEKIMHNPAFPSWNGRIEVWQDNKQQTKVQYLSYGPADEGILMQFTGLKDKNGVEICEGDVLLYNDTDKISVWYQDSLGCFLAGTKEYDNTLYYYSPTANCVVIGNIYQHPEPIPTPSIA